MKTGRCGASRLPFSVVQPYGRDKARESTTMSWHATAADAFAEIDRLSTQMARTGAPTNAVELIVVDANDQIVSRAAHETDRQTNVEEWRGPAVRSQICGQSNGGTSSFRLTGHSLSHFAQCHWSCTWSPLMMVCTWTDPAWPHVGQICGTRSATGVSGMWSVGEMNLPQCVEISNEVTSDPDDRIK